MSQSKKTKVIQLKLPILTRIKKWINSLFPTKTEYDDYRLVLITSQVHLAEINKLKLEEEGIKVFVINKKDSSYNNFGQIELYVKADDVVKANYLINKTYE